MVCCFSRKLKIIELWLNWTFVWMKTNFLLVITMKTITISSWRSTLLKKTRYKCPNCGSKATVIWGYTRDKCLRFKCKECKKTFSLTKKKKGKEDRYFKLFTKWIETGNTVESLIDLTKTKITERQLIKYFYKFLDKPPKPIKQPVIKYINLKVDAKYLGKWGCCIVFKERQNVIYWYFCEKESYLSYMYCFSQLRDLNYEVLSITSDKHSSLISSVKEYFRGLPHQYCLVHIQLRCETLLTKRPNTEAGRDLLQIVSYINQIKTEDEKNLFFLRLWLYEYRY